MCPKIAPKSRRGRADFALGDMFSHAFPDLAVGSSFVHCWSTCGPQKPHFRFIWDPAWSPKAQFVDHVAVHHRHLICFGNIAKTFRSITYHCCCSNAYHKTPGPTHTKTFLKWLSQNDRTQKQGAAVSQSVLRYSRCANDVVVCLIIQWIWCSLWNTKIYHLFCC